MQVDKKYTTKSAEETQKLGEDFAKKILKLQKNKNAVILALQGNLGGGKTTFLQGFAKGLSVSEKVLSPTFLIIKNFKLKISNFKFLYHIDCYRINKPEEILELGWKEIISDPKNIIAVEWPEKIKKYLPASPAGGPKNCIKINFKFIDENTREIIF